jgi:hypothetical protein
MASEGYIQDSIQLCHACYEIEFTTERGRVMLSKREILEIIDSTASFNAYIEEMDALDGPTLELVTQVGGVDGEEWTDEECLEIIKDILDLYNAYRNTHKEG